MIKIVLKHRALIAVALAATLLQACRGASASSPTCSDADAKSAVIELSQEAMKGNLLANDMVDLEKSTFTLDAIRTDDGNGFKVECSARLTGDIVPKQMKAPSDPAAEKIQRALIQGIFSNRDVKYTVQNTDDGKIYVQLMR